MNISQVFVRYFVLTQLVLRKYLREKFGKEAWQHFVLFTLQASGQLREVWIMTRLFDVNISQKYLTKISHKIPKEK